MMQKILFLIMCAAVIGGCSAKPKYKPLKIDAESERVALNMQTLKQKKGDVVETVLSALYLSRVYPEQYGDGEYFLIACYTPRTCDVESFRLNGSVKPLEIGEVDDREIQELIPMQHAWNQYYVLKFPATPSKRLTLTHGSGPNGTGTLDFERDD